MPRHTFHLPSHSRLSYVAGGASVSGCLCPVFIDCVMKIVLPSELCDEDCPRSEPLVAVMATRAFPNIITNLFMLFFSY
ncbi:hypothetical protein TSUD_103740 [Trifolium subterraneum]|uniref:Uncharacterized protein n=1 Tax=Trifolium subterraneum TaxID=3900 RepID=A0A2Z6NLM3_TRISU|nr:hypothetical protein TSUD_103740 [Trifolium subterraneum]